MLVKGEELTIMLISRRKLARGGPEDFGLDDDGEVAREVFTE